MALIVGLLALALTWYLLWKGIDKMSGFSSSSALLWLTIPLLALSGVGSIVLLRRIADNRLVGSSKLK